MYRFLAYFCPFESHMTGYRSKPNFIYSICRLDLVYVLVMYTKTSK